VFIALGILPVCSRDSKGAQRISPGSPLAVIGDTIVAADLKFATEANGCCFAKAEM
jgi:hypothetical protein